MKNRLALIVVLALIVASGCTWNVDMQAPDEAGEATATDPFFVQAELFYPERIALPGDSEMLVALDAVDRDGRTTLTRFSSHLDGRQVPIPLGFSVEPDSAGPALYELSAAIVSGENLLRLTGPVLVSGESGSDAPQRVRLYPPMEMGFGQAWRCDTTRLQFGAIDNRAFLAVDEQLHSVEHERSASGALYRSRLDPEIAVHEKAGDVLLLRGESTSACSRVEPLALPVSGGGNEPGWHVEIDDERIALTSDYGEKITDVPLIQTGASGRTTRFRGLDDSDAVIAAFRRATCRDSATGMPHPYAVEIQLVGDVLTGCGGEPRSLLTAAQWKVTRLDGEPLPEPEEGEESASLTLRFDDEGRVSGHAACNQFTADYTLSGEGLSVGPIAGTLMACRDELMKRERRFLQMLEQVQRFDIGPAGELVLISPAGDLTAVAEGR